MPLDKLKSHGGAGVVRQHLAEIERARERGVSRREIYNALCEEYELTISYEGFKRALTRARAARSGAPEAAHQTSPPEADRALGPNDGQTPPARMKPKGPLKAGDFGAPDDFNPADYDERYK